MQESVCFYKDKLYELVKSSKELSPSSLVKMHLWINLGILQEIITPAGIGYFAEQRDSKLYNKYLAGEHALSDNDRRFLQDELSNLEKKISRKRNVIFAKDKEFSVDVLREYISVRRAAKN